LRKTESVASSIQSRIPSSIWRGTPSELFDGKLQFTLATISSAYISQARGLPSMSTGYWFPNQPLTRLTNDKGKVYYQYKDTKYNLKMSYVGFANPIPVITQGTLVRLSLARWWQPKDSPEERCYLQISGWYDH
jgi:hypothetical protein